MITLMLSYLALKVSKIDKTKYLEMFGLNAGKSIIPALLLQFVHSYLIAFTTRNTISNRRTRPVSANAQ